MTRLRSRATVAVAAALAVGRADLGVCARHEAPPSTHCPVSVESEPAGARVDVDGRPVGTTPIRLSLAAGEHRLTLVKEGYLPNRRSLRVPAGAAQVVRVGLTPDSSQQDEPRIRPSPPPDDGGGGRKWILVGLGVAAVGAAAYVVATRNKAPEAGTIGVTPAGTGMAGATSFGFVAQGARDPEGDALEYRWDFGDGTTAEGERVSKVFGAPGTFTVRLTVRDGSGHASDAPPREVTVLRSMAGVWTGAQEPGFLAQVSVNLTQRDLTLGGTMTFSGDIVGPVPGLTGTIGAATYPTTVSFTSASFTVQGAPGRFQVRFTGTVDASGNTMSGTVTTTSTALTPSSFSGTTTFRR